MFLLYHNRMVTPHNIYIHVPFCASKCNYCAFFSRACATPNWDAYADGIIREIQYWAEILGHINVPTVFFGGGTPSLMPVGIFQKIMDALRSAFNLDSQCEITLESNPGTIDATKLDEFIQSGVTRISIGVQSFDDEKLKFLGRRHDAATARKFLDLAMARGVRVSADFIYGLPGDNVRDMVQLCRDINSIGLPHCSLYELSIEPGTPFATMNLQMPTNDEMANMYNAISDNLNIPRYEVSNYATPGNECLHNLYIWDGAPYIGIGRGAAGRVLVDGAWYEQLGAGAGLKKISNEVRAIERVITGMRTIRGVALDTDTKKVINMDYVNSHPDLLRCTSDNRISATRNGMLILDNVICDMIKEAPNAA